MSDDRRPPEPTARLRRAVASARQLARADGRRVVTSADLRAALGAEAPAPPFRGDLPKELDDAAREWWLRAEREAAALGHDELAPEHLRLVEAGERERPALLAQLAEPFGRRRWWRPRSRRAQRTRAAGEAHRRGKRTQPA
jgi:hypothetical protein